MEMEAALAASRQSFEKEQARAAAQATDSDEYIEIDRVVLAAV
jgi:hypothetical protein